MDTALIKIYLLATLQFLGIFLNTRLILKQA